MEESQKVFYINQELLNKKYIKRYIFTILIAFLVSLAIVIIFYELVKDKDPIKLFFFLIALGLGVMLVQSIFRYLRVYRGRIVITDEFFEFKVNYLGFNTKLYFDKEIDNIKAGPDYFDAKLGLNSIYVFYTRRASIGPVRDILAKQYVLGIEGFTESNSSQIVELVKQKIAKTQVF